MLSAIVIILFTICAAALYYLVYKAIMFINRYQEKILYHRSYSRHAVGTFLALEEPDEDWATRTKEEIRDMEYLPGEVEYWNGMAPDMVAATRAYSRYRSPIWVS